MENFTTYTVDNLAMNYSSVYNTSEGTSATNASGPVFIFGGPLTDLINQRQFSILVPSFVYTALLMLVGMPGNALVIIVYLLKMSRTTSRHFIISLAVCDFINCAFGMPVELSLLANYFTFDFPILCKVSRFSTFFMNNTSSLVLLGIAVDRFRRVRMPLRPNMTVHQSKVICIAAAAFSLLSAVPGLIIYGTRTIHYPVSENTFIVLKTCYVSDTAGTLYPMVFSTYLFTGTIAIFLPLVVMYAFIGQAVIKSRRQSGGTMTSSDTRSELDLTTAQVSPMLRQKSFTKRIWHSISEHHSSKIVRNGRSSVRCESRATTEQSVRRHGGKVVRAGRTTTILFLVTLFFMLAFVPYLVICTIRYVNPQLTQNMNSTESSVYNFTLRSYLLNSAVNPLIYCFLNRQFRLKVKLFFQSFFKCGSKT